MFEYEALPRVSQNLLNISLFYYTLYQTSCAEKKREDRSENDKDPNQIALERFLDGQLKSKDSKVHFHKLFKLVKQLNDANPLAVT